MKKYIALLLVLLLVVSMTACGSKKAAPQPAEEAVAAPAAPAEAPQIDITPATEAAPETVPETQAPTVPTEPEPAFDTSWAKNRFEALLPEMPLGDSWYREQSSPSHYSIQINHSSLDVLETYLAQLESYGFRVTPLEKSYKVSDGAGHSFSFGYHSGSGNIGVSMDADLPAPAAQPIDTSWASNYFEQQIPQPPVSITNSEWLYGEYVDQIWRMDAYDPSLVGLTGEYFDTYTKALHDCGFASALYYERHNDSRGFHALNADTGFYVDVFSNEENGNAIFTIKVYDLNADLGDYYPRALDGSAWDNR